MWSDNGGMITGRLGRELVSVKMRFQISVLGQRGQPTRSMLQKFDSQKNSSIGKFKNIMEGMDRHDVVTILDEWIKDEWGKV